MRCVHPRERTFSAKLRWVERWFFSSSCSRAVHGFRELQEVVASKIVCYAAGVRRGAESNDAPLSIGLRQGRLLAGHIEDEAGRLLFAVDRVDQGTAFRWHQLRIDAITQQPHRHCMGRQKRILRTVRGSARTVIQLRIAAYRQKRCMAIVTEPWT